MSTLSRRARIAPNAFAPKLVPLLVALMVTSGFLPTARGDESGITVQHKKVELNLQRRTIERYRPPLFGESEDGREVFLLVPKISTLYVLDTATDNIKRQASVGSAAQWMALKSGRLWVYHGEELVVYDGKTLKRLATHAFPNGCGGVATSDALGDKVLAYTPVLGPKVDRYRSGGKPAAVRVFNSKTMKEEQPLTFPAPPSSSSQPADPLVMLKHRRKAMESNLKRMEEMLARYDTAVIDAKVFDLKEALKTPSLNKTAKEVLEREVKNIESSRERAIRSFVQASKSVEVSKESIKQIDAQVAAIERERAAKETTTPKTDHSPLLGLNLLGTTNPRSVAYHNMSHMHVSPDGRYLYFRHDRQLARFLIDRQSVVLLDMGPRVGKENFSYSADGQFIESVGTDGEGYRMNSYPAGDLNYKVVTHDTGAYPRSCAHDPAWPFFYAQKHDKNLLIFNEWTGTPIKSMSLTGRGDEVAKFFPLAKGGEMYVALESGIYRVSLSIRTGLFTRDWKLTTLPDAVVKAGEVFRYKPAIKTRLIQPKFELQQAPQGMKISSTTGEIVWSPKAEHVGRHKALLVVTSTKKSDPQLRQAFTINVIK